MSRHQFISPLIEVGVFWVTSGDKLNLQELLKEYCELTGRPSATITIEEYLILKKKSSELLNEIPMPKKEPIIPQKKEELLVNDIEKPSPITYEKPATEKDMSIKKSPSIIELGKSKKKELSNDANILKILQSVSG